jgi:hypothetical protein
MGTAVEVIAKIRTLEANGVTNLYIRGFYSYELPISLCDTFAEQIIPAFESRSPVPANGGP